MAYDATETFIGAFRRAYFRRAEPRRLMFDALRQLV